MDSWHSCLLYIYNYYTSTHRVGAILQSPCPSVRSHFRNRYLSFYWKKWFDIWLWHGDLYRVSPFQVYCTSTSCLQCDLEFFMFAVMKTFVSYLSFYWKKWFYIWYYGFGMVTCTMSPLSRFTAHLLSVYRATYKWTSGGILSTT